MMARTKGAKNHPKKVKEGAIADWRGGMSLHEISKKWGFTGPVGAGSLIARWREKDPTIPYRYDKSASNSC